MASGHFAVPVSHKSRKNNFSCPGIGGYRFRAMPFGVKSRGSCYQRLMGIVLKGLANICIAYLDDVIILGNTLTEHLANIEAILQRLREHNIKAEPSKCKFLLKETRHL